MESASQYSDFSQDQMDRMIKRAWGIKKRFEQQCRSSVVPDPTCRDNIRSTTDDEPIQEVDTKSLGSSTKSEPQLGGTPSPLMGSMYGWDLSISQVPERERDVVDVKVEVPEQDLNTALHPEVPDPKEVEQAIATKSDSDICAAGKHQIHCTVPVVVANGEPINDVHVHDPRLPEECHISAELSYARVQSVYDTVKTNTAPSGSLFRSSSINSKRMFPYLKLRLLWAAEYPIAMDVQRKPGCGTATLVQPSPPSNINSGQHGVTPYFVNDAAAPSSNGGGTPDQHTHLVGASGLGPEASTSAGGGPGPSSSSKVCQECGQKFRRPSGLMDHMHIHTGIKRHQCPFCRRRIAYSGNFTDHKKKCKARKPAHI